MTLFSFNLLFMALKNSFEVIINIRYSINKYHNHRRKVATQVINGAILGSVNFVILN